MNYIGKFISNFKEFYNEINSATLTGAIDVIIVKQPDGTFACSPFHVRFGKMGVLRSKEKIVDIEINGEPVNIHMKLGDTGEAFFVEEFEVDDDQPAVPSYLATSPLPSQLYDTGIDYIGNQLEKMRKEAEDPIINQSAPCTPGSPSKISLQGMITGDSKIPGPFGDDTSREIARTINSKSSRELCGLIENRVSCDSSQDESIFISDRPESCYLSLEGQDFSFRKSVALQTSEPVADSNEEKTKEFFQSQQPIPSTIVPPSSLSSKKRRRKKSTMKKLSNVKSPSKDDFNIISQLAATPTSGVQTTPTNLSLSSNEVEEVFVMDDDDANICSSTMYSPEEETVSGMTRSASLPAASLSSFSNVNTNVPSTPTTTTTTTKQKFLPLSDIHPFSDGEVDQLNLNPSHKSKRPSSPLSDTEYENSRLDVTCQTSGGGEHIEWGWGEFPRSNTPNNLSHSYSKNSLQTANQIKTESGSGDSRVVTNHQTGLSPNESSKLFGVLKFMKKDDLSKSHASKEEEGVFLDDLNTMDPEKAGLYLSSGKSGYKMKPSSLDDTESGNGSSLSQSPPCSGPTSQDEEESELEGVLSSKIKVELTLANYERFLKAIAISVCGGLDDDTISIERFEQSFVAFDDFCSNPIDILQNPALVVRIDGKYYNWPAAAPLIMSLLLYQRPLPVHCINTLLEKTMPKKQSKPQQQSESRSFWWSSWTRSSVSSSKLGSVNSTSPSIITQSANLPQSEINNITEKSDNHSSSAIVSTAPSSPMTVPLSDQLDLQMQQQQQQQETITQQDSILSQLEKDSISVEIDKDNHQDHEHFHVHDSENLLASSELDDCQDIVIKASDTRRGHRRKNSTVQYKKVLRISSRQIASLNLQEGRNEVVFSVTTAYQGTTRCKCSIYLWNHDDKIIVSDIDGTITKSDILGHILPVIGKDWAQSGVANLFNKIQDNGYKLLYLSARAIGQARITRDYLKSVRQGDICLPDGPLLLSPTSLISALHREVIEKKPEEFKIKCLRDIQCLFPTNPFYAGFGNKINDTWAYRAINIPSSRIFTINHRGELRLGLIQSWHSSYNRLSDLVDQMFPPLLDSKESRSSDFLSEYSSFNYWREPVLDISQFEPTDFDKGLDNEELPQQQEQQEQQQAQPQPQPQQLLQLQQSPSPTNQQLHSSLVTP